MSNLDLHALLRSLDLRVTPQRIAIAKLFLPLPVHMSPQETYEKLKGSFPSLSPNTVYLTLAHFEKAGLLQKLYIDGKTLFDGNINHHNHAYCRICGKLVDLPTSGTEKPPLHLGDWQVQGESRVWFGQCPQCTSV